MPWRVSFSSTSATPRNTPARMPPWLHSLIGAEELNVRERDALLQLCRQRLDGFREQRGEELARSSPGTSSAPVISGPSRPLPV
jgi:hypothetical protein